MTMRVTMLTTVLGESGSLLTSGQTYTVTKAFGASLVGLRRAIDADAQFTPDNQTLKVATSFPLTADHDGVVFSATAALTVTIPAGLTPRPRVVFIPPPSGNLSVAVSGGAQVNGATSTLTRSRASNPAGVALTPYTDADGYGLSGS